MVQYSIGDWMHDNEMKGPDYFWKITSVGKMDGQTVHDVAYMRRESGSKVFVHWGNLSSVLEHRLRPVTDINDLLCCKISDIKVQYDKAIHAMELWGEQLKALQCTQQLLEPKPSINMEN